MDRTGEATVELTPHATPGPLAVRMKQEVGCAA